jgi:type IV pilus assembly protein PilB
MDQHPVMGELLLREGLLTEKQLKRALEEQRHHGGRLGYHLIRLGYVNVQRLSQFLKDSMGLIPYDLSGWVKDRSVTDYIPSNLAQFYQVVPVEKNGSVLTVAIADLDNPSIIPALEELTGLSIDPVVCPRETVIHALEHFYGVAKDPGVVRNMAGDHLFVLSQAAKHIRPIHWSALKPDSSAAEWLRTVLVEAIRMGCRTITIKPDEKAVRVSFRTGETVQDRFALASRKREEMDALLFELARLRDVKRGPRQEGRVRLQVESRFLTLHVKAMSTLQGTRYTLTIYDEKLLHRDWERLNNQLEPGECKDLDTSLSDGPGLLLLAGSPGPGITQVYYALVDHLSRRYQPAVALEEYSMMVLRGVSQQEVSREDESTWPELISMALKQEPALFACFPVKERQSMELALLAASHTRVVAVLHQPDATATLRWLLRNQFRSPLRAGVLKGILTVASIPKLCSVCKLPVEVVGRDGQVYPLFTRQGCEQCLSWESLPAEAVMEWLPMNEKVKELLGDEPQHPDLIRCILEAEGIPLAHRVLAGARDGLLDAQEARDFLP